MTTIDKRNIWDAAIGLQAVDGLKPSEFLKKLAEDNISGLKSFDDINRELKAKYSTTNTRQMEADFVAFRIAVLLEKCGFVMSSDFFRSIHSFLFEDIIEPEIVGEFRKYNISKREMILLGDSVRYGDYLSIESKVNQVLNEEKTYKYSNPLTENDIDHLSSFTSKLWQIHPFGEGNTRTTAVFIEQYLKLLGYKMNNDPFKNSSDYYRNALVRSCNSMNTDYCKPTNEFLNRFYMNLLNDSDFVLDSFDLIISNQ